MKINVPSYTRPTHLWIDDKGFEFVGIFVTPTDFAPMCSDNLSWRKETIKANKDHARLLDPFKEPCYSLQGTAMEIERETERRPLLLGFEKYVQLMDLKRKGRVTFGKIESNENGIGKLQRELDKVGFKHHDVDLLGNFLDIPDNDKQDDFE